LPWNEAGLILIIYLREDGRKTLQPVAFGGNLTSVVLAPSALPVPSVIPALSVIPAPSVIPAKAGIQPKSPVVGRN
jgi:hypothetical protein